MTLMAATERLKLFITSFKKTQNLQTFIKSTAALCNRILQASLVHRPHVNPFSDLSEIYLTVGQVHSVIVEM